MSPLAGRRPSCSAGGSPAVHSDEPRAPTGAGMRSGTQRRVSLRKATMGIGLVALVVIPAQPAAAAGAKSSSLACGTVVTQDVRLAADLNCAGDALVVDGAGTITVDLQGRRVTSTGGTA